MQHPSPGIIHRSELCGLHLSHACMHMARGPLPRLPQVFPWELHRIYLSWQSFQGKLGAWWCLNGTALQKSDELLSCSCSKGGIPKELMGHMGRSPRTGPFQANRLGFQWSTASGLCQVDGRLSLVFISPCGNLHFWRQAHGRRKRFWWHPLWNSPSSLCAPVTLSSFLSAPSQCPVCLKNKSKPNQRSGLFQKQLHHV